MPSSTYRHIHALQVSWLNLDCHLLSNGCIRSLQNFGFTVEQEGDSYSIMFQEAVDAVKFCLQVRV